MVALLARHGLIEMMDVISAYAELCVRREPDSPIDPLDTISRMADPAFRRIAVVAERLAAEEQGRLPAAHAGHSRRSVARRRREALPRRGVGRPSHDEVECAT
jgi:hypothetical protein